ncbi:MAG: response regulator [Treponemataceae bacterium]|nr:response regulator [Treponemataceae bacterium]
MRKSIALILKEGEHDVVGEAEDGDVAVAMYKKTKPDIVLLDITMPGKDGLQALKEILTSDPNAKVIMCSAMGNQENVVEAIRSGAKDFILKPPTPQKLLEVVEKYV